MITVSNRRIKARASGNPRYTLSRAWFLGNSADAIAMRERALELPRNAILECWCVRKLCHAQVIADWVNARRDMADGFVDLLRELAVKP